MDSLHSRCNIRTTIHKQLPRDIAEMSHNRFDPDMMEMWNSVFFFQAEDGIRDVAVTGVQTCALPISNPGINAKVQPGEGERQCRAGYRRDRQAQPIRYLRPGLGSNQRGPGESRHQRFTKALKPAASRPFRAASVAFKSA